MALFINIINSTTVFFKKNTNFKKKSINPLQILFSYVKILTGVLKRETGGVDKWQSVTYAVRA